MLGDLPRRWLGELNAWGNRLTDALSVVAKAQPASPLRPSLPSSSTSAPLSSLSPALGPAAAPSTSAYGTADKPVFSLSDVYYANGDASLSMRGGALAFDVVGSRASMRGPLTGGAAAATADAASLSSGKP